MTRRRQPSLGKTGSRDSIPDLPDPRQRHLQVRARQGNDGLHFLSSPFEAAERACGRSGRTAHETTTAPRPWERSGA